MEMKTCCLNWVLFCFPFVKLAKFREMHPTSLTVEPNIFTHGHVPWIGLLGEMRIVLYFLTFLFRSIFLVNSEHSVLLCSDLFCMFTSKWILSKKVQYSAFSKDYSLLVSFACLFLTSPRTMMCYVSRTLVMIFFIKTLRACNLLPHLPYIYHYDTYTHTYIQIFPKPE